MGGAVVSRSTCTVRLGTFRFDAKPQRRNDSQRKRRLPLVRAGRFVASDAGMTNRLRISGETSFQRMTSSPARRTASGPRTDVAFVSLRVFASLRLCVEPGVLDLRLGSVDRHRVPDATVTSDGEGTSEDADPHGTTRDGARRPHAGRAEGAGSPCPDGRDEHGECRTGRCCRGGWRAGATIPGTRRVGGRSVERWPDGRNGVVDAIPPCALVVRPRPADDGGPLRVLLSVPVRPLRLRAVPLRAVCRRGRLLWWGLFAGVLPIGRGLPDERLLRRPTVAAVRRDR